MKINRVTCVGCDTTLPDHIRYCPHCGISLAESLSTPPASPLLSAISEIRQRYAQLSLIGCATLLFILPSFLICFIVSSSLSLQMGALPTIIITPTVAFATFPPVVSSRTPTPEPIFKIVEATVEPLPAPSPSLSPTAEAASEPLLFQLAKQEPITARNASKLKELARLETDDLTGKLAYSPTGEWVAIVSEHDIWLYDTKNWQPSDSLSGHTSTITDLTFSPNGRLLASSSADQTVRLWDLEDTSLPYTLTEHSDGVTTVAFSRDSRLLASGGLDETIQLWDLTPLPGLPTRYDTLRAHTNWVDSLAFSPDNQTLASASWDKRIFLWPLNLSEKEEGSRQHPSALDKHTAQVRDLAFSPTGTFLASAGADKLIYLWNIETQPLPQPLRGHTESVRALAFSPDGTILASASNDDTVQLWDINKLVPLQSLDGHESDVSSVVFSPDRKLLISGSDDGTIRFWGVVAE